MTDERAAGMVTSPEGTERLHQYWVHGEGAAKIRWGQPGDFDRCVMHLGKFIKDPKGYCNLAHHAATGMWPAEHAEMEHKAGRSAVTAGPDYDSDGLDGSWDGVGDGDIPDLTGLGVEHFEAAEKALGMDGGQQQASRAMAPVGSGGRFKALKAKLAAKGAHDPGALAAWIGRKKYGHKPFQKLAAAARKAHSGSHRSASDRSDFLRVYNLEDIHILRSGDGGNGRIVEAYAAVFGEPAEIQDHEGHYIEVIDPGAFNTAIEFANRNRGGYAGNVKVLYNHGMTVQGTPSERGSMPIGVPLDIRAESRGLLTRTEYNNTPLADEVLENIRAGSITSQSFTGRIIRSDPALRRGDRYRPTSSGLPTVTRTKLGLREYGPVLWPAYSGAEILGVRMSTPGGVPDPDEEHDAEALPPDEGPAAAGGDPLASDEHSARYHQHALYRLRSQELREKHGLVW